ncbi:MAG: hypothetical protein CMM40_05585 [Rhodospirillaceae bacterium]|nr:hypothetical protein [Rhodospirillaceae bacterium]
MATSTHADSRHNGTGPGKPGPTTAHSNDPQYPDRAVKASCVRGLDLSFLKIGQGWPAVSYQLIQNGYQPLPELVARWDRAAAAIISLTTQGVASDKQHHDMSERLLIQITTHLIKSSAPVSCHDDCEIPDPPSKRQPSDRRVFYRRLPKELKVLVRDGCAGPGLELLNQSRNFDLDKTILMNVRSYTTTRIRLSQDEADIHDHLVSISGLTSNRIFLCALTQSKLQTSSLKT